MFELAAGVLEGLASLHPGVLYLLAGLFTALETSVGVGLLVPGDGVVLLAGTTATTPYRFAALVAVTVLGSLTGESVGYLVGRRYGQRLRTSRLGRRLGEHRWAAAEAFLAGRGGRAVAAARFVALVHALVPVVAGTVGMSYRRLVSWGALGAVAWSMLYVAVGAAAGASWRQYGDRLGLAGLAVLGAALAILVVVRAARRGPGRPDRRVRPRPSARSQPEHVPVDSARPTSRVELPVGGRDERHHTAA
jgi:membrane-associated protein